MTQSLRKSLTSAFIFSIAVGMLSANEVQAARYIGDLVYCDESGMAGVFDGTDSPLNGVTVDIVCTDDDGVVCADLTTVTGTLHGSVNPNKFNNGCADAKTFDPTVDLSGRYLVEMLGVAGFGGCMVPEIHPPPFLCTVTVDPNTLPQDCDGLLTPVVGGLPFNGNGDGDFCDPEDGPFPEDQILGGGSIDQATCELSPSPGPGDGVHTVLIDDIKTRCSLFADFGYEPVESKCGADFPTCGGPCPPGQTCVTGAKACQCRDLVCQDSDDFPTCGGECPKGQTCVMGADACLCSDFVCQDSDDFPT